jgi:hypothetical protein
VDGDRPHSVRPGRPAAWCRTDVKWPVPRDFMTLRLPIGGRRSLGASGHNCKPYRMLYSKNHDVRLVGQLRPSLGGRKRRVEAPLISAALASTINWTKSPRDREPMPCETRPSGVVCRYAPPSVSSSMVLHCPKWMKVLYSDRLSA